MSAHILLIDDDHHMRLMLEELFEEMGHTTESISSAEAARERLKDGVPPDLVLLDMKLQGGNGPSEGLDLIRLSRTTVPSAPVLFMTGFADDTVIQQAHNAGAWDLLVKDRHFETFLKIKVRNALFSARIGLRTWSPSRDSTKLISTWNAALSETHTHRKGALPEQAMQRLFSSVPGFQQIQANATNGQE